MQFLNPASFALAALAVVPLLLYFFRRKSKTVEVSTLVFFKSLAREHQESAWLRRIKRLLSLLLTLIILLAAVFALTRLVFAPKSQKFSGVVILLDRSASMAAQDPVTGKSRLDAAKDDLRTRLAALPESVGVALIAYDSRPEIVQPKSLVRRELLRHIDEIEVRPIGDNPDKALATATRVAGLEKPSVIWHVSDRAMRSDVPVLDENGEATEETMAVEPAMPEGVQLDFTSVALPEAVNVGITAFQISKVPLVQNQYEAFIQIACSASAKEAVEVTLEVFVSGSWADTPRKIDLEPGQTEGLIMPIDNAASGQMLEIRLSGVDGDSFPLDDVVMARLPEARPLVVAWITENPDPFTELALNAVAEEGALDVLVGKPSTWGGGAGIDVVIFDGWVPAQWPTNIPAIVINPNESSGPVRAVRLAGDGIPHDAVRVSNAEHPVLFRVSSGRAAITQTAIIDTTGSLEPLWFAGEEPVLAAGEVNGQRLVVMGFSAEKSGQLPLMASYPLLIGNAVLWCAEKAAEEGRISIRKTGELVSAEGQYLDWTGPKEIATRQTLSGGIVELDRIGVWESQDGKSGSALLLSAAETNLPVPGEGDKTAATPESGMRFARGEVTWFFVALLLTALLVESWLFHRHAVY